eukprot:6200848-Pleurochrysis_carterae.AAC.4
MAHHRGALLVRFQPEHTRMAFEDALKLTGSRKFLRSPDHRTECADEHGTTRRLQRLRQSGAVGSAHAAVSTGGGCETAADFDFATSRTIPPPPHADRSSWKRCGRRSMKVSRGRFAATPCGRFTIAPSALIFRAAPAASKACTSMLTYASSAAGSCAPFLIDGVAEVDVGTKGTDNEPGHAGR